MMVDLRPDHLEIMKRILAGRVPEYQVRAFGSRARWTAKDTSDLDLVVMTDAPLGLARLADLREAFSESDLPFRVDVLDWAATGVEFREIIEQDYAVIQQPGSTGSSGPTWRRADMAGSLPSDWSVTSLGACSSWYSGGTPRTSVAAYWDGDIPWITASSLQEFYIRDSERRVTQIGLENGTRLMPTNSVLFVVRGMSLKTEFRVGIARRPVAFGQDCKAIVANDGIDPLYLANVLRAKSKDILGLVDEASHGTGRLQTGALQRLEIPVPPLDEQRAIACILGALDDKIELNRRMNQTLEGIARAIFKSWFVDFDPVRAKAAGQQPPGLAPHIADLFPDTFEASELGRIPKGWEVGTLGMIANEVRDTVQPAEIEPGTPYIALQHMPRRCIALNSWDMADDIASAKLRFKVGDILFGKLRPYFHKVGPAPLDGVCSTDIVVCRPQDSLWHGLTLGHTSSDAFVAYTDSGSTGTKMPRTNWRYMSAFRIALPPSRVAAQFAKIVRPMIDRIRHSIFEQQSLAALRDTLLPKLISGELRVPDAERFLTEVSS